MITLWACASLLGIDDKNRIKSKTVVISGGTSGIGLATAKLLGSKGAKLFIFSRNRDHLLAALKQLDNEKVEVHGAIADIGDHNQVSEAFAECDRHYNHIDILINNAGIPAGSIVESNFEEARYAIDAMILGCLACSKEAIIRMKKGSQILNIGSLSAEIYDNESDIYVAAKAGTRGFTFSLRKRLKEFDIKVSLIEPGLVATLLHDVDEVERSQMERSEVALKSFDIAQAIYFILNQPEYSLVDYLRIRPTSQSEL